MALIFRVLTISLAFLAVLNSEVASKSLKIKSQKISSFSSHTPDKTRFGKLEFVGGLILTSKHEDFGGISAFRFTDDTGNFIALTDKARVISGKLVRERDIPVGFENTRITRIKSAGGKTITGAKDKDSESIAFVGDHVAVGYERNHRISFFKRNKRKLVKDKNRADIDFNQYGLGFNKGLEAIALHPTNGKIYAFPEIALNGNGNYRGFVVEDDKVTKEIELSDREGYSLTDAQFLPNGDLIMLERYFSPFFGIFMQLRRVPSDVVGSSEPWGGVLLIEATGRQEIDNMEGLSLSQFEDGGTRITVVSDDNFSKSQRTVFLEFRLID